MGQSRLREVCFAKLALGSFSTTFSVKRLCQVFAKLTSGSVKDGLYMSGISHSGSFAPVCLRDCEPPESVCSRFWHWIHCGLWIWIGPWCPFGHWCGYHCRLVWHCSAQTLWSPAKPCWSCPCECSAEWCADRYESHLMRTSSQSINQSTINQSINHKW